MSRGGGISYGAMAATMYPQVKYSMIDAEVGSSFVDKYNELSKEKAKYDYLYAFEIGHLEWFERQGKPEEPKPPEKENRTAAIAARESSLAAIRSARQYAAENNAGSLGGGGGSAFGVSLGNAVGLSSSTSFFAEQNTFQSRVSPNSLVTIRTIR